MRVRLLIQRLLWTCMIPTLACESGSSSEWVLLSADSDGQPTFIDAASIRQRGEGVAVYRRVVGDPSAADRVELVQGLDCVNLRWAFLSLDESLLDSIAGAELSPDEWSLLALNPANRVLLGEVCQGYSPSRWIRVLEEGAENIGDLREVWVDRETLTGPNQDTVRTEFEDPGFSEEIFRARSRWDVFSPDSSYVMVEADVSCDRRAFLYLESTMYSGDGEVVDQGNLPDFWIPFLSKSFDERVYTLVCDLGRFFQSPITQ